MRFRPKALIFTMAWPVEGVGLEMEVMWRAVEGPLPLVISVGGLLGEYWIGRRGELADCAHCCHSCGFLKLDLLEEMVQWIGKRGRRIEGI